MKTDSVRQNESLYFIVGAFAQRWADNDSECGESKKDKLWVPFWNSPEITIMHTDLKHALSSFMSHGLMS